jgi:hypothetical protein
VCWDDHPEGRFTATYNGITHRSQACDEVCMQLGIGSWNIDGVVKELGAAKGQREANRAAEQEAREASLRQAEANTFHMAGVLGVDTAGWRREEW